MSDTPLLELRGVSKHFGAVIALHEVDFKVSRGPRDRPRGRQRRRQVDADQVRGRHLPHRRRRGCLRRQPGEHHPPARGLGPRHRGRLPGPGARRQPRRGPEHVPGPRGARAAAHARRDQDGGSRARDPQEPVGDHDPQRAPDGGRAFRRPAPVGRGGQGRDVELEARDPRRAHRRAGRGPDAPGARPGQAPGRAGPGRDPHLPQPARHLRGGGRHHGPAPGSERGRVQAHRDRPSRRWSTRSPPARSPRCPAWTPTRPRRCRRDHRRRHAPTPGSSAASPELPATGGPTSARASSARCRSSSAWSSSRSSSRPRTTASSPPATSST